ncbi:hypothetical protein IAQ61_008429 [Plenodomus lingam]|uniref:Myb-like domain-containing protein n=1 Tax=Leptosphaeria maculans (strain JN3 / isolate v23.1.3 / race Av1-4-5-6-7-8) TaxID=985895 RepID=E4ZUB1_LEPMJ|nr:hypothetical protein LEMA_P114050.1 [Plenodomus lingam JN3]KAH9866424.1 hypothetical protein IAQ61_008429 [Plenodomus lingam]CBX94990.1 hypothetical protein LEMA_P114050.1 [Plenodomus lingam JN3]
MATRTGNDNHHGLVSDRSKDQNQEHSSFPRTGSDTAAPIAKVLNNDAPAPYIAQPSNPAHNFSTKPFSGRLIDLLLDTPASPTVRERVDYLPAEARPADSNHSVIQLPKLPQLAAKKTQRPRIPPLLQGLHQPPPLPPSDRLFPPITSDKNAFTNSSRDRGSFDSRAGTRLSPPVKTNGAFNTATAVSNNDESCREKNLQKSRTGTNIPDTEETHGSHDTTSSRERVQEGVPSKPGRQRRRWSKQETKDLLVGVSRYGIGSWKKILQSPDLNFHGRTAVDLKDRFRVCCPSEASKKNKSKQRSSATESQNDLSSKVLAPLSEANRPHHQNPNGDALSPPEPEPKKKRKSGSNTVALQLADIGISGPFAKKYRRPQCKFSAVDDLNLLKGFEKHGSVWRAICDDAELGLGTRRPTDLRDRFRIKYPEKFAESGHKLKAKHDKIISEQRAANKEREQQTQSLQADETTSPQSAKRITCYTSEVERLTRPNDSLPDMTFLSPPNQTSRSNDNTPYTFNPFPAMFDDYGSLEHDEFSNSPIILNRDILQWADANHTSSYNQVLAHGTGDQPSRSSNTMDGNHLNNTWNAFPPRSTDLSKTALPSTCIPSSRPSLPNELPTHTPSTSLTMPTTHTTTNANNPSHLGATAPAKNSLPQTPNLPTIVFPHVPAASARNTLHNLPTPADLLLGVEEDAPGFLMDSFSR